MDEGYGGRVPRRVDHEERRRQIADALVRTAAARGLHATGMREVAAEAGVSLRLVQYYFGTKEELLLAAMQHLAARFSERAVARFRQANGSGGPASPRDVIAAILAEALPADDDRRTFYVVYTAYLALSLTDPALAIAPLVKNSAAVIGVVAAQLRAAQTAGDTPARLDPDLEAFSLMAMSAGLATSVLAGQSAAEQAQAVIDYHLDRLFPAYRPALLRRPHWAGALDGPDDRRGLDGGYSRQGGQRAGQVGVQVVGVAEDGAGDEVRRAGRGRGEGDLWVRGQRGPRLGEPGRLYRQPEHGLDVHAERPVVDVDLEVQQAGPSQFVDTAPHRRFVPVDRGGDRGVAGPPVAGKFSQERLVLGREAGPEGWLVRVLGGSPRQIGAG